MLEFSRDVPKPVPALRYVYAMTISLYEILGIRKTSRGAVEFCLKATPGMPDDGVLLRVCA
jgi:hypothetical protein